MYIQTRGLVILHHPVLWCSQDELVRDLPDGSGRRDQRIQRLHVRRPPSPPPRPPRNSPASLVSELATLNSHTQKSGCAVIRVRRALVAVVRRHAPVSVARAGLGRRLELDIHSLSADAHAPQPLLPPNGRRTTAPHFFLLLFSRTDTNSYTSSPMPLPRLRPAPPATDDRAGAARSAGKSSTTTSSPLTRLSPRPPAAPARRAGVPATTTSQKIVGGKISKHRNRAGGLLDAYDTFHCSNT